ncbi:MAG: MFS transporter [Halobacteriales archaeon]|nr:MFS transporter [Halobacteriales archaeon]
MTSRRRLLMWSLLATAFLLVNFHRTATGVLASSLAVAFDTSGTELGVLHSSFFYIYAALQLPAGLLVDRYGPRRAATTSLVVMTVGVVWFASAGSFPAAFLARALIGLGGSTIYIATLAFLAAWYRADEYATMTGLTIAASGIGGVLATTPLAYAIGAVGWRSSILVAGVVGGLLAGAVWVVVRDSPPSKQTDDEPPSAGEVLANTRTVLAEVETWLLGGLLFLALGMNFTVLGLWGVPFVADVYDVSVQIASLFVLVGNVGTILGSPVFGIISDRLGTRTPLMILGGATGTVVYIVLATVPPLPVVGLALFLALFANGSVTLAFTVVKEQHPPAVSGTATGVINSLGYFGAAIFPAVMGAILDAYWTGETVGGAPTYTIAGYRVAFLAGAGTALLATLVALALHYRISRTPRTGS